MNHQKSSVNSEGTFTFSDLTSGNFGKLKDVPVIQKALISLGLMPEPDIGTVEVVEGSTKAFTLQRETGGSILVITGTVKNTFRKAKPFTTPPVLTSSSEEWVPTKRLVI